MSEWNKAAILIFSKTPIAGQVKTRLIPALGEEGALALYEKLLARTVRIARSTAIATVRLVCTPTIDSPLLQKYTGDAGTELGLQSGDDLGARMRNAIRDGLMTHRHIIVIGCDCPGLEGADIETALEQLSNGTDVVLGPAADGGYYLIGVSADLPLLFDTMPWGTGSVLELTRSRLRAAGLAFHELRQQHDLDTPADLERYYQNHAVLSGKL